MDLEFAGYRCTCGDLQKPLLVYRQNTFTCVIRNYITYLKARNLTDYVDVRKLERLLAFNDDRQACSITWCRAMGDVSLERAGNVVLCLFSPVCHTTIAKLLDAQCCGEFIGFVRKHISVDIAPDELKSANEFLKIVAPKKF